MLLLENIPEQLHVVWIFLNVFFVCFIIVLIERVFYNEEGPVEEAGKIFILPCLCDIQSICVNTFLKTCQNNIDGDEENWVASVRVVQSAHILLIQFWEIALPQKKLSLFCHSVSQVAFRANNLIGGKRNRKQEVVVFTKERKHRSALLSVIS